VVDTEVTSPESVTFTYDVAGLGSRFAALLIDLLIQLLLLFALLAVAGGTLYIDVAVYNPKHARSLGLSLWVWAALVLLTFAILWGYFVFFEMMWNGKTPGKRIFGLRVIRAGGYPVDLLASAVRNLIRYVDFLPGTYSVGVFTMFFSRHWQRLGDHAAGTLVVRDRSLRTPTALASETAPTWIDGLARIDRLTPREYHVVREFLRRRDDLEKDSRDELSRRIADPLAEKLEVTLGAGPEVREWFLQAVASAYQARFD